jgi:DNA-binding CsgD family transcriptional regulator
VPRHVSINALGAATQARLRHQNPHSCEHCGAQVEIIASIEEPAVIGRILEHLQRSGCRQPPATPGTRAERARYRGTVADVAREVAIGLEHTRVHTTPWLNGELLFWKSPTEPTDIVGEVATPYRLMLTGDWQAAARAWEHIGAPYEQALALSDGPEEALREALTILDRLAAGPGPLATIVRRSLRERGARGIPRGPTQLTRNNPLGLTARALEVLKLLAQGCTSAQLALRLHRSPTTVEHHVSALLEKLGVHSRTEAVALAFARGMVTAASSGKVFGG